MTREEGICTRASKNRWPAGRLLAGPRDAEVVEERREESIMTGTKKEKEGRK